LYEVLFNKTMLLYKKEGEVV